MSGFDTLNRRTFLRTCTAGAAAMSSAMAADPTYRVV
ncbi:MAG: twin-arginine translocation signal domain-containing protein, partial [Bryobacteraceae bacterium]|nr:twin-arginine translocation signal domain-containing protein [Bryobacteraceae bacterium]